MRYLYTAASIFIFIILAGCSMVRVSQDYDPEADLSRFGTWQWREAAQALTGDIRVDNPLLNKRIRRAVENHLRSRNINLVRGRPDLFLTYHLVIENRIYSDTYYSTMGIGGYYHPWYGGVGTETHIRQYDESRLTIDIHAADTGGLLWRGVGIYRPRSYETPQDAAEAIQKTVDRILGQFPPGGQ